jgi:hypothetical protein
LYEVQFQAQKDMLRCSPSWYWYGRNSRNTRL